MKHPLVCGDKVVIVGGKYAGRPGHVVKVTEKMTTVHLLSGNDIVRVMSHNVELHSTGCGYKREEQPRVEICHKQCCKDCMQALMAAKDEVEALRDRVEELLKMLDRLSM
jgi:hypothetical protein